LILFPQVYPLAESLHAVFSEILSICATRRLRAFIEQFSDSYFIEADVSYSTQETTMPGPVRQALLKLDFIVIGAGIQSSNLI
jgi:hypothetical protein